MLDAVLAAVLVSASVSLAYAVFERARRWWAMRGVTAVRIYATSTLFPALRDWIESSGVTRHASRLVAVDGRALNEAPILMPDEGERVWFSWKHGDNNNMFIERGTEFRDRAPVPFYLVGTASWAVAKRRSTVDGFLEHLRERPVFAADRVYVLVGDAGGRHIFFADQASNGSARVWFPLTKTLPLRPVETVHTKHAGDIVSDARRFFESEAWYRQRNVPWRRGFLFHGPPGCGKTSAIHALASACLVPIYTISLSDSSMDDGVFRRMVGSLPPRSILVLEDIDSSGVGCLEPESPSGEKHTNRLYRITFSGLLNGLDGLGCGEGRLLIATTNHRDKLKPALVRPGRIDREFLFEGVSEEDARAMHVRFVGERGADAFAREHCGKPASKLQELLLQRTDRATTASSC